VDGILVKLHGLTVLAVNLLHDVAQSLGVRNIRVRLFPRTTTPRTAHGAGKAFHDE